MKKIIDLTHTIDDRMPVYPGDEPTRLIWTKRLEQDKYNNHCLDINMHAGTHIDIPMHLLEDDRYMSDMQLSEFVGEGKVLDVRGQPIIRLKDEYRDTIAEGCIVLLCTGSDKNFGSDKYFNDHPVLDIEFAKFLVQKRIKMLGMDTPSPDKYPFDVHKLLLKNDIFIIENLKNVESLLGYDKINIIAFPLKVKAAGALARVAATVNS